MGSGKPRAPRGWGRKRRLSHGTPPDDDPGPANRADTFQPNAPDVAGKRLCTPWAPGAPLGENTPNPYSGRGPSVARPRSHNLLHT